MVRGVVFDMDGTMVNNMYFHRLAWIEFAKKYKQQTTESFFLKFGRTNEELLNSLFGTELSRQQSMQYALEKERIYREIYLSEIVEVKGLSSLLKILTNNQIEIGMATSAPPENVEFVLEALRLKSYFKVKITDDMVDKGKPAPDLYIKACSGLGLNPSACIAFEDTPIGITAAKNAGLKVIAVITTKEKEELTDADLVVKDFTQINMQILNDLINL